MKKSIEEKKIVMDWLAIAQENFLVAQSIIKEEFAPYHTVCFMCQNSGEKYLKAYLIWKGWTLEKIHDLLKLLFYCVNYENDFESLKSHCKTLNQYIITSRYPDDLPYEHITKKDAEDAIDAAEKIARFVTDKVDLKQD